MTYTLDKVNFRTNTAAPTGLQWVEVELTLASADQTFHDVTIDVILPSDPALTVGQLRSTAFEGARTLLDAALKVLDQDPNELFAKQEAAGAAEAARLAQWQDPELLKKIEAGDQSALETWRTLAG